MPRKAPIGGIAEQTVAGTRADQLPSQTGPTSEVVGSGPDEKVEGGQSQVRNTKGTHARYPALLSAQIAAVCCSPGILPP